MEEFNSAIVGLGERCVVFTGITTMHQLCAGNWDMDLVSRSENNDGHKPSNFFKGDKY